MQIRRTELPGCVEVQPNLFNDHRGRFVKMFQESTFREHGLPTHFSEWATSVSTARVLRGLHFQLPPHDQAKLVYCVKGRVLDVGVDLRVGSPTYGKFATFELDSEKANGALIPRGFAHGFYVLGDSAVFAYLIETPWSQPHDTGILWNSVGIPWPESDPILSDKDRKLPPLSEFKSPFRFNAGAAHG